MSDVPAPAGPHRLRAADSDREHVAEALRQAAAEGRLSFAELDQRIERAYAARTFADLAELTDDLPGPGRPAPTAGGSRASVAILSGSSRAGPWVVAPSYLAIAILGGVELDLRHARFTGPELTIQAFCLMGGVSITVPEDAQVDVSGIAIMGGFDHQASGPGVPGAPRIRVVGFALMGGVEVKRKRPGPPPGA